MSAVPASFVQAHMPDSAPEDPPIRARAEAVSALFRDHNRTLIRFLQSKLQNEQEAREVAQEAYVRLLELDRTGAVGFLRSYLFRIASNLAIDRLRSRVARQRLETLRPELFEEAVDPAPVEARVLAADEMRAFWACLAELPLHYRQAFVLSRVENLSTAEIATRIGKSERMIRRYLVHTLVYCRHRLSGLTAAETTERIEKEAGAHD
jgi:RNA polymerase sigma-70 factor (ECF subfamily)